jgi:hypothetical protein
MMEVTKEPLVESFLELCSTDLTAGDWRYKKDKG